MTLHLRRAFRVFGLAAALAAFGLSGCWLDDDADPVVKPLACDDSMKTDFQPDADTSVVLVKAFSKGDALLLAGAPTPATPIADNDVCVVKLNVGPGHAGPADAPSTSPGIGIEIWLPSPANWNDRIHVQGGGGWAGTNESSTTELAGLNPAPAGSVAAVAMLEGAVSASTDTGHRGAIPSLDASFAMNPDGTINTALWTDFSERGIHEMAVKTKALAKAYYGRDARFAYWNGGSTGGRQGLKEAQANPEDFDGILDAFPAINWTKFITTELYPQIVMQRDLGANLAQGQLDAVSNAAIAACDVVGGVHLGYIPDPGQCRYDPVQDLAVLCVASGGTNASADCVTPVQANAFNKFWYGQTPDGSVPDPAVDNGYAITTAPNQKWYGVTRGTTLAGLAGAAAFPIAADMVALELQDATLGSPFFVNATGNGAEGWKALTYPELSNAWDQGVVLQPQFADINTDEADLSAFANSGGKMLLYHGLADQLIPPQGSIHYVHRVADEMGGLAAIQSFLRFYLVPGMGHGFANGTSNPNANPPLPTNAQLYALLTDWVENGTAPEMIIANAAATPTAPAASRPLCLYPLKASYTAGDPNQAASYACS